HGSAHPTGTAGRVVPPGAGRGRHDGVLRRDRAVGRRRKRGGTGGGVAHTGARVGAGRLHVRGGRVDVVRLGPVAGGARGRRSGVAVRGGDAAGHPAGEYAGG